MTTTFTTPALTPAIRFSAHDFGRESGDMYFRARITQAGQVEGFAHCYTALAVEVAKDVLRAAAERDAEAVVERSDILRALDKVGLYRA